MVNDRHAFRPTVSGMILEKRVLPTLLAMVQFSTPNGPSGAPSTSNTRGMGVNFSTISSSGVISGTSGYNGNAGLGVGFSYSTRSLYALSSGFGIGYSLSAGSRGSGGSNALGIFGGPSLNPYGPGVGGGAGLQTGPRAGGSGGTGGVSPPSTPGGPQPAQVTPTPSGQPATPQGQGILPPRAPAVSPAAIPLPTAMSAGPTNPLASGVETGSPATSMVR
ncbi:MAG: hypothetical protein ABI353_06770 [Isosphaeraceae bacterium]